MPELPEVEKMTSKMSIWGINGRISKIEVLRGDYFSHGTSVCAVGQRIKDCYRAGKYMIFPLDRGTIVCHNAMSGYWDTEVEPWTFDYVEGKREATQKDVRVKIHIDDGPGREMPTLQFHDSRLFGSLTYFDCFPQELPILRKLGPEAIPTKQMFPGRPVFHILDSAVLLSHKKPIKQLLLEQERIAGVGNIYAAEALWLARIHPARPGVSLNGAEHQKLTEAIQCVLTTAMVKDLRYDEYLNVYRRKNCVSCGKEIQKIDIAKRTTYFCVHCQH